MSESSTHFVARCPQCAAGLKIRRIYAGRSVRCKQCAQVFQAEEGSETFSESGAPAGGSESDRISVDCRNCQATLNVRRSYIGKSVSCKHCGQAFLVEATAGTRVESLSSAAEGDEPHLEVERIRANLGAIQAERDQMAAELAKLREKYQRAKIYRKWVDRAGTEMRSRLDQLTIERDTLRDDRDSVRDESGRHRAEVDRLTAELSTAIEGRSALEGEVEVLRGDRDSARAESEQRAEAIRAHEAEQARHASDRDSIGAEVDRLRATIDDLHRDREESERRHQNDLDSLRAERDRLAAEIGDRDHELTRHRAEADERGRHHAGEVDSLRSEVDRLSLAARDRDAVIAEMENRHRSEVEALRAEVDRLTLLTSDREATIADRDRLHAEAEQGLLRSIAEVEALRAEVDRLSLAARDRDAAIAERDVRHQSEVEALRAEVDRLLASTREHDEAIAEADRRRLEEIEALRERADRLAANLGEAQGRASALTLERDRLATERDSARVQAERLRIAIQQLERDQLDRGEQDGSEIERLRAENRALHLRVERFNSPAALPPRDDALRAAHARIQSLEQELADLHRLEWEMRGLLSGIGIRFRER